MSEPKDHMSDQFEKRAAVREAARPADPLPLFHTNFAGTTRLTAPAGDSFHGPRAQYEDVRGDDVTAPAPHDWNRFGHHPNLGTFRVYYEGGDATQRYARILADESDPTRNFLRFWIGKPNVTVDWSTGPERKARVQTEIYENRDLHEIHQSVRLRLSPSFALLERYPGTISWMTLMEFWNQPFWGDNHPYPFRISLSAVKPDASVGGKLFFGAHAQTKVGEQQFDTIWSAQEAAFPVRYGSWMKLDVYYREGDAARGRFVVAVTPEDGPRRVVIDVANFTHHPDNPAPGGLTHYNPMKLYTSAELVEFINARGEALQADWSDFSLWQNRRPPTT